MEHDVEDASYHSTPHPAAQQSSGMEMGPISTQSHRHRQHQTVLLRFFAILILTDHRSLDVFSGANASPLVGNDLLSSTAIPTPSSLLIDLSRRTTNSNVIHDKYFIPGVAVSGGMLLVALLCCFMLFRKEERRVMPPGPGPLSYSTRYRAPTRQPERSERPPPSETGSVNTGRFSGRSKIQRKSTIQPQPLFGIDPLPQPTPSEANSYFQHKQPVPGVPQHPGLAMYSPEPLPYANSATQMQNVAPSAGANSQRSRRPQAPIPIPPPRPRQTPIPSPGRRQSLLSDGQSSTQVGSENALSYLSSVRANEVPPQAAVPPRQGTSPFAVPAPNPPSPPTQPPPAYYQQSQNQQQQQVTSPGPSESALSYLSSEAANRPHAQAQSQAPFHPPPPEGTSSFAVPAPNPPSPPAQFPPANQQYQYQYQDQRQQQPGDDTYSYRQEQGEGPQLGVYQYAATKSSGRREQRGSSRVG